MSFLGFFRQPQPIYEHMALFDLLVLIGVTASFVMPLAANSNQYPCPSPFLQGCFNRKHINM